VISNDAAPFSTYQSKSAKVLLSWQTGLPMSVQHKTQSPPPLASTQSKQKVEDMLQGLEIGADNANMDWSDNFNQHYKSISAPTLRPMKTCSTDSEKISAMLQCGVAETKQTELSHASESFTGPEGLLLLDLDKCSIMGSDGNDLGIAMQWMNQSQADLTDLYRLLLNPCVKEMYDAMRPRYARLRVALYTARSTLVQYRSIVRTCPPVAVPWDPAWLEDGQLYIPPSAADGAAVMGPSAERLAALLPEEREDIERAVERLLATRNAVRDVLGLAAPPDVVVTASPKCVARTARRLGCGPAAHAYLWDDNCRLLGEPGALVTPPFLRLAPSQRRRLLDFLEARIPPASLPADLVDFMLEAPPSDRSISRSPTGEVSFRIPEGAEPGQFSAPDPWPLPPPPQAVGGAGGEAGWDVSDVSPAVVSSPSPPPPLELPPPLRASLAGRLPPRTLRGVRAA
jgi:hypothetical protein